MKSVNFWPGLVAILSGATLAFAFAPFYWVGLSLISVTLFYALIAKRSAKKAAGLGLLFGLGFFGVGASWVFVAIYVFGGTPASVALLITVFFVFILACFFALLGYLLQKFFKDNTLLKVLLVYPALWALLEVLRSWVFTGFPWLLLGHSVAGTSFAGLAPIFGVYGTSFLMVFASGLFYLAATPYIDKTDEHYSWKRSNYAFWILIFALILGCASTFINWTQKSRAPLTVSLIQGNIQQSMRWDPIEINHILVTYKNMTQNHYDSNLIVWPEAAIPLTPEEAEPLLNLLNKDLHQNNSALLTGIPIRNGLYYYNAVVGLGNANGTYIKRHLVPFGEYVLWEKWLRGLIQFFDLPMSHMLPGDPNQHLIRVDGIPTAIYICYEIAYSTIVHSDLPLAELLVTVTDDAWFGHSWAPWQHLQIGQFQALTSGRPMLFVGNSGVTAIIDQHGTLQTMLPTFKEAVLNGKVTPYYGNTPWIVLGDKSWVILIAIALIITFIKTRKKK